MQDNTHARQDNIKQCKTVQYKLRQDKEKRDQAI